MTKERIVNNQIADLVAEIDHLKSENERLKAERDNMRESLRKILMEAGGTSPYAGFHDIFQLAKEALTPKQ